MSSYTMDHKYGKCTRQQKHEKKPGELKFCNSFCSLGALTSALRASLAIGYLISNASSWNNCGDDKN